MYGVKFGFKAKHAYFVLNSGAIAMEVKRGFMFSKKKREYENER